MAKFVTEVKDGLELHHIRMLSAKAFKSRQEKKFRDLTIVVDTKSCRVEFTGMPEDVMSAKRAMLDILNNMTEMSMKMSGSLISIINSAVMKKKLVGQFRTKHICAVFDKRVERDSLTVYALNDKDLGVAIETVKIETAEAVVPCDVTDLSDIRKWRELVNRLESKHSGLLAIKECSEGIFVSGAAEPFEQAVKEVKRFLDINYETRSLSGANRVAQQDVQSIYGRFKNWESCAQKRTTMSQFVTAVKDGLELHHIRMLNAKAFKSRQEKKFRDLTIVVDTKSCRVEFTGMPEDVMSAKTAMFDILNNMVDMSLKMSVSLISIINGAVMKKKLVGQFRKKHICAVFDKRAERDSLRVYALNDKDLGVAIETVKVETAEAVVPGDVTDLSDIRKWRKLVNRLESEHSGLLSIKECSEGIFVSGAAEPFERAVKEVKRFLDINSETRSLSSANRVSQPGVQSIYCRLKYWESRAQKCTRMSQFVTEVKDDLELHHIRMLNAKAFKSEQEKKFRDLTIVVDTKSCRVEFTGMPEDVMSAKTEMLDILNSMTEMSMKMSGSLISIINGAVMKKKLVGQFRKKHICAVFDKRAERDSLTVYALNDKDLGVAIESVKVETAEAVVPGDVTDLSDISKWRELVNRLESEHSGLLSIRGCSEGVVVSGATEPFEQAVEEVKRLLKDSTTVHDTSVGAGSKYSFSGRNIPFKIFCQDHIELSYYTI